MIYFQQISLGGEYVLFICIWVSFPTFIFYLQRNALFSCNTS